MPTLKEIAREAGVSGALVSYYLNGGGKGRMREETRRRIDEAIRKLKYHPNRLARSLRTGRSRSIGFLAGNIANPYIGHLAEEALEEALEHDYTLIPALTDGNADRKRNALEFLRRNRIDGLFSTVGFENIGEEFNREGKEFPAVRPAFAEPGLLSLQHSVGGALREMVRFLRSRGHSSALTFFGEGMSWNAEAEMCSAETGFPLLNPELSSAELFLERIAAEHPGAIVLNGQILYPVLDLISETTDYRPDLIIGVDEFHTFLESPRIAGGIRTSTAETARTGIRLLIERAENPALPREGIHSLTPGTFVDYTSGSVPVMLPASRFPKTNQGV